MKFSRTSVFKNIYSNDLERQESAGETESRKSYLTGPKY